MRKNGERGCIEWIRISDSRGVATERVDDKLVSVQIEWDTGNISFSPGEFGQVILALGRLGVTIES